MSHIKISTTKAHRVVLYSCESFMKPAISWNQSTSFSKHLMKSWIDLAKVTAAAAITTMKAVSCQKI